MQAEEVTAAAGPRAYGGVVLLVGRDNWLRDEALNHLLRDHLLRRGYEVVWEDPAGDWILRYRQWLAARRPGWLAHLLGRDQKLGLRAVQVAYALGHPRYLAYLLGRKVGATSFRARALRRTIQGLGPCGRLVILARSSGGRVASLVADSLPVSHIVCLGYPFQHPQQGDEPARYRHLASLQTPLLILQGERDAYGGRETIGRYALSPSVKLCFMDTDHDFVLDMAGAQALLARLDAEVLAPVAARRH